MCRTPSSRTLRSMFTLMTFVAGFAALVLVLGAAVTLVEQ
jgi:hypothetical protein